MSAGGGSHRDGLLVTVTLPARLDALDEAVALARGRLDESAVQAAAAVLAKARARLALGADVVVAALAGGTGSGKSSLFNALAGADLAEVGPIRPVTSDVRAWSVGEQAKVSALLDWLHVHRRHDAVTTDATAGLDGLVLLDLPDHDSVEVAHRLVVDRYVEKVDVLVWVVDPLKYAQRALHAGYLRRLATHAEVIVVVLNRIDELEPDQLRTVAGDLRRVLTDEGLRGARVLTTSALTGAGVGDLRDLLAHEVRRRRAVAARLAADVRTVAAPLQAEVGTAVPARVKPAPVTAALADATGVTHRAADAARAYREVARDRTRPLLSRAVWGVLALLLRPFRLLRRARRPAPPAGGDRRPRPVGDDGTDAAPAGGVEPGAAIATGDGIPVAVRHALLTLAEAATNGLPAPWPRHVRALAAGTGATLPHAVPAALDRVALRVPCRRWWPVLGVLWSVVEAVAVAGLLWLVSLGVLAWLQLPAPPVPNVAGRLPWPTALLLGGALVWLAVGWVRNRLVDAGAATVRRRTGRALAAALDDIVTDRITAPVTAELDVHRRLVDALTRATT